ncbi:ABC transporter permease [Paenibacillus tianjinensis]|uniref:ABC-2 family transporter protein n=1 Tax=Paenibacillus tianjinensis TaxID=2810347 RepID=A0ABX7LEZ3_9BACL|nr:ABC-2 family transporter protein [Paenibacillus tianjinensis]QSF46688.1 ABC-2 family transporter protein [Paenibacillus tianjinensis]
MNSLKYNWQICRTVAGVTYKEWSAYRTHSMVSIIVGPVYFMVQYFIWTAVYGDHSSLGGFSLPQMIRYFGATALIGYLIMDFADWNLSMLVRTGKFLTFHLRPIHHRSFALFQKIGHRSLGFLFEFLPCLLIFIFIFGVDMRPASFPWTILSVLLAFMMNFYVNYTIGLTSFWLVQSNGIRSAFMLVSGIFSGALIPLDFFPHWLQVTQFFLPFQYIAYMPAMVFTGHYSLGGLELSIQQAVGVQAVAVFITFGFNELIRRLAMKQFTAVGA